MQGLVRLAVTMRFYARMRESPLATDEERSAMATILHACTAFLQARYPRQRISCPRITSFVNFSSTRSSVPSFTTISSAALR